MSPMKIFIPDSNIFASGGLWVQCRWVAQDEDDGPVFVGNQRSANA